MTDLQKIFELFLREDGDFYTLTTLAEACDMYSIQQRERTNTLRTTVLL